MVNDNTLLCSLSLTCFKAPVTLKIITTCILPGLHNHKCIHRSRSFGFIYHIYKCVDLKYKGQIPIYVVISVMTDGGFISDDRRWIYQ